MLGTSHISHCVILAVKRAVGRAMVGAVGLRLRTTTVDTYFPVISEELAKPCRRGGRGLRETLLFIKRVIQRERERERRCVNISLPKAKGKDTKA